VFAVAVDGDSACFSLTFWTVCQPLAWCIIWPCMQYMASAASMAGAWFIHWPVHQCGQCAVYTDPLCPKNNFLSYKLLKMHCNMLAANNVMQQQTEAFRRCEGVKRVHIAAACSLCLVRHLCASIQLVSVGYLARKWHITNLDPIIMLIC